jgi:hypothetical protein
MVTSLMAMTRRAEVMRSEVRVHGGIPKLLHLMERQVDAVVTERAVWTLNNMASKNPFNQVRLFKNFSSTWDVLGMVSVLGR